LKPSRFRYVRPETLNDTLSLLAAHTDQAAILGGGQSLVPMLNLRVAQPEVLIDINSVPGLDEITATNDRLVVGGRTRHNDVFNSPLVRNRAPLLFMAMGHVAHEAVRNRGTLGGSLALADPAAELPCCAVCLGAEIVAQSIQGERSIPAGEFFEGIYSTALRSDELIVRVEFPILGPDWKFHFSEVAQRHGDFAIVSLAACFHFAGAKLDGCRITFGGLETFPRRVKSVEDALIGAAVENAFSLKQPYDAICSDLDIVEGGGFPSEYRRHVACELLRSSLKQLTIQSEK
jgi:carbon-monoxide dehydrogenase medium subunit